MKKSESRLNQQPKYKIGEVVIVWIKTRDPNTGFEFENDVTGIISTIEADGTSERDTYKYGITTDMPGCYHSGKAPFKYILEHNICLAPD